MNKIRRKQRKKDFKRTKYTLKILKLLGKIYPQDNYKKRTIQEKIKLIDIIDEKIICESKKEVFKLSKALNDLGKTWASGKSYLKLKVWYKKSKYVVYNIKNGTFNHEAIGDKLILFKNIITKN